MSGGQAEWMNGQAFLSETAGLIERGWCCGADARDRYGQAVTASHPAATAWSLLGALAAVWERPHSNAGCLRDALWGISGVIPDWSLDAWNDADGRTQADTLRMLADAKTSLEQHPPPVVGWSADS